MTPELFRLISSAPEIQEAMARAAITMSAAVGKLPITREYDNIAQQLSESASKLKELLDSSKLAEVCKLYHPKND